MRSILSGLLLIIFFLFLGLDVHAQEIKKEKKFHFNLFNKEKRQERKHEREREREGEEGEEENDEYDGPDKAAAFEYNITKNPVTGKVPKEKLLEAIQFTKQSRAEVLSNRAVTPYSAINLVWTERGPNSDVVGASNGNTRANSAITAGRVRAIMVDSADASHKTVWIGGVDGGLWKTTDITTAPSNWTLVNDYLSNLAVTDICQDPSNNNIMYFCTGEAYYNADAVKGNGVFKSTDRGVTWTQLSSSSSYGYCTRILCDYQGNVYLGTRGLGLFRSNDGGSSWTSITPSGLTADICDLEISSTSALGRLHVVSGIFSAQAYRYTDAPSTVTSDSWTAPVTAFPTYNMRAEIAVSGNVLYALPANASYEVPTIYKSTDGGANWTATTGQPTSGWASGQGWYALSISINPANTNQVIIGGLESYKTTNGGTSWTKISTWVGTTGQYVHADIHKILWYDGGTKLIWGCDGGIHYSADGGTTIRDRNAGLRIKQFYSCAIHPTSATSPNYFLAGAQDNGTHQLNGAGLTTSTEVVGGDGCFVAIDQDQPQNQFGSYVYNAYRRSTNSGSSWSSINFSKGTVLTPVSFGSFINPFDYDNTANILYAAGDAGEIFRWTTALTTAAGSYYTLTGLPTGATILTGITALNSSKVSCVAVSPYTAHKVYFGTAGGRITYLASANTAASASAGVNLTGTMVTGSVSCINFGTTEQFLLASSSSYGVNNVMMSADGGTTWTAIDGNLPDMPVRWCMFYPGFNTKAIIATEMGVYTTDLINGASTIWSSTPSFPAVRTNMLKYRTADKTLLAATHGRGLWTTTIPTCTSTSSTTNVSRCSNQLPYLWNGTNYQATGTYTYTTTNAAGCDSVATLNLTVKQTTTSTTSVSRCSNQLPYLWNGTNYQATGTYSFTTTNAVGCDSVATLNFTVKQTSTSTTNVSRCSNQLPYLWNGTNYQAGGTYTFTTTNAVGCDSVATLNLTVKQTSSSPTTNVSRCSNQLPYLWNGVNYQATGVYTYTTTNVAGCDSVATLNFTVKQTSSSTTIVSRCTNQLPYLWNGTNYQATGVYTYTTTNTAGCDSIATLNLTIKQTTSSITNVSRCSNQLPYLWNGTNYQATGTYTYTTTNSAGCDSVATLNFTVKQTSTSTSNISRCSNQLPYLWNGTNYQVTGTYTYSTTNTAGCDSVATLNFTVKQTSTSTINVNRCSNQLPYLWNGSSYSAGGTYSYITTNTIGCDSVAILNLTIVQVLTSIENVTRCSNQLPYSWNGNNYQASGTYSFAATSASGCDSIATLNLTVIQTSSSITNVTRCSNQLPYLWNGTNYQATGTYTYTITNSLGCDSIATLNFIVKQTSSSITNISRCSNQLPYSWNGTNYQTTGTYSYTTTNAADCDSIATLNFTVKQTSSSTTNISRCENQLPYSWNGTNYQATGTYSYTTTNAAVCDSLAILNLTVNPLPIVNAGSYPSITPASAPISLIGTPSGGTFTGTGVSSNTFNPAVSGIGTFMITYNYTNPVTGCNNSSTTSIVVSAVACNFSVAAAISGNTNACGNMGIGDSAVYSIAATDAASYTWSVSNATTMGMSAIRTGSSVKVKYTTAFTTGTITLVVKGCDGTTITRTLSISKTVPGAPAAITSIGGSTAITFICPYVGGSSITYVATPPTTNAASVIAYRWTLPTGAQLVSVNAADSSSITIGFPTAPSTLVLSVIAVSGCGNSTAKTLTLNKTAPAAPALINGLADVCASIGSASQSTNVNYSIAAVNNAASYLWAVPTGATLVSGQGTTSVNIVFASSFVSGSITVQSISPCGNSVAKTLTVYKRVAATPAAIQKEFTPTSIAAVTNVCGLVSETYRIKKVTYATSYNWILKVGTKATITHINASGANDTAVIVTFLSGLTKDTLSVTSITPCSESVAKTVILNATLLPPTPTSITSSTGSYNACIGNQITYTRVVAAPTATQVAASVYRWTKPNNTVIVSAATDSSSITLQFNTGYIGGSVTCKGQTPCGILGTAKSQALTHTGCAAGTVIIPMAKNPNNVESSDFELNVYPNPNDGNFNLDVKSNSLIQQSLVIQIIDFNGKIIKRYTAKTESGIFSKHFSESNLAAGVYTLRVISNKTIKEVKLLIDKGVASVLNEKVEEGRRK